MSQKRITLNAHGTVQGVFYRASAKEKAQSLNLKGWVRNNPDGTVSAVVEGDEESLNAFIAWAKGGSDLASVQDIAVEWGDAEGGFDDFDIRYQ